MALRPPCSPESVGGSRPAPAPPPPEAHASPRTYLNRGITIRQREVLRLIAAENTTKDIAAKPKLSVKTIDTGALTRPSSVPSLPQACRRLPRGFP